jgi:protein disulfide-isomerase A1
VGSTYKEIIFDNDNDVFVKYYAPWCGHCQQMAKTWIDLAEHVKDVPGLVIAEMDSTENEAEDLDVPGFPTIKLYVKGKKNESVEYEGDREIFNFKDYLWENSPAYRAYFPEKPTLSPVPEPFHTP